MNGNITQKKGFLLLAIGVIMIICILFAKIKSGFTKKDNVAQNNSISIQTKNIEIDENAGYMEIINQYFTYLQNKDSDGITSLFPKFANIEKSSMKQQVEQAYKAYESECGKNIKLSYSVKGVEEYDEKTLKMFEDNLKEKYINYNKNITKLYRIKILFKITGDSSISEKEMYFNVGIIENNWYIF